MDLITRARVRGYRLQRLRGRVECLTNHEASVDMVWSDRTRQPYFRVYDDQGEIRLAAYLSRAVLERAVQAWVDSRVPSDPDDTLFEAFPPLPTRESWLAMLDSSPC